MSTIVTGASGTTYISGTGTSGFDSSSLIQVAVEAKMQTAYLIDDQIDVLNDQVSAWGTVLSDLTALSDAAETLSASAESSVFDSRSAYLSSSAISSPDNVLGVTVTDDAELGSYTVEVVSLATAHKVASGEVADKTAALGYDGTFSLAAGDVTATDIIVTSDMTLADLAEAINDVSSDTGVTATLIKSSDSGYTLVLASANTGESIAAAAVSGADVLQSLGVTGSDGSFADELQAAAQAEVVIDGVTVTSSSNDIEDVLTGVSISLYNTTAGDTVTLEIGQDLDDVYSAVEDLVDAYNTYRSYALTQQETDDEGAADSAVLFGDSLLRNINSALYSLLSRTVEVDGTTYSIADLGISYGDDNTLELDADTLEEFLTQHADVAEAFFQQSTSVSSSDLYVGDIAGDMAAGDYTVEVTLDGDGNITAATIDGTELTVSNQTLTGAAGSAYEGLRLVYTGTASASITLSVEDGFADQMVATLENYADEDDGLVSSRVESLSDTIDTKQERRDRIAEKAEDYEDYLVDYYARIEAAIEASELALAQIEALFGNSDDD